MSHSRLQAWGKAVTRLQLHHVRQARDFTTLESIVREQAAKARDLVHRLSRAQAVLGQCRASARLAARRAARARTS